MLEKHFRTRVKICGITRPQDALDAVAAGVDALGLVFYPPSPRAVTVQQAAAIAAVIPPFITLTGLFVNASAQAIREVLEQIPLGLLQFHGEEGPRECAAFAPCPYVKAVRMREDTDLHRFAKEYGDACGLLLDTYVKGVKGGTGKTFDWHKIPSDSGKPLILAGGLNPDNVAQAVRTARPYAVDVSGGVEKAKGIKDCRLMRDFVRHAGLIT